jgi:hypothetical protein
MNGPITLRRFAIPAVRIHVSTIRGALIRGALPALAGALMLAGCGGSGNTASTSAAAGASASATAPAGLSAFQTCLKQHGVTIKPGQFSARPRASFSPGAFPSGSPRASFAGRNSAAFKACAKYAPAGFGTGANRVISSSALAAFKSCLTANGVKVTGSTASAILSQLRNSTGKTATAVRTCRVLLQPAAPTPTSP